LETTKCGVDGFFGFVLQLFLQSRIAGGASSRDFLERRDLTANVVFADGKSRNIEYTGAYAGRDYAVSDNPKVGTIAQVRVDNYISKTTTKRGGIRAWLGHVSLNTTNAYADVDLQMKAKALATCEVRGAVPPNTGKTTSHRCSSRKPFDRNYVASGTVRVHPLAKTVSPAPHNARRHRRTQDIAGSVGQIEGPDDYS
jgi:hypothetical protein